MSTPTRRVAFGEADDDDIDPMFDPGDGQDDFNLLQQGIDEGNETGIAFLDLDDQSTPRTGDGDPEVQFGPRTGVTGGPGFTAPTNPQPTVPMPGSQSHTSSQPQTDPSSTTAQDIEEQRKQGAISKNPAQLSPGGFLIDKQSEEREAAQMHWADQRKRLINFVNLVEISGFDRIFNNNSVLHTDYFPAGSARLMNLYALFKTIFSEGFRTFDPHTTKIVQRFLSLSADIFERLVHDNDKKYLGSMIRFLAITIVFGIDRAITSLQKNDSLMTRFKGTDEDRTYSSLYQGTEIDTNYPEIAKVRSDYYIYFRADGFDPRRVLKEPSQEALRKIQMQEDIIKEQQKHLNIFYKEYGIPMKADPSLMTKTQPPTSSAQRILAAQASVYPKPQQTQPPTRPLPQGLDGAGYQQTPLRNPDIVLGRPRSILKHNQDDAFHDHETAEQFTQRMQHEARNPAGVKRQVLSRADSMRTASSSDGNIETETDIDLQDSDTDLEGKPRINPPARTPIHVQVHNRGQGLPDSDEDQGKKFNAPPVNPFHIQAGVADPHFGTPLSAAGKVYNRNKSYREVPREPSGVLSAAFRDLQLGGQDNEETRRLLATSLGMAQVMASLTKDYKNRNKKIYEEIPPPDKNLDLRIDSFDYNIWGKTITQVLGPRFSTLRFPSDTARKIVMKGIFQKVAAHPDSGADAKLIALNQLGQVDPYKANRSEIQTFIADSYSATRGDLEIIPPPILGNNELDNNIVKTFRTRVGMGPTEKLNFGDMQSGRLKIILHSLKSVITNSGLSETEAYALLRLITEGVTNDIILLAEHEHKIPFDEYWLSLQKTQSRMSSIRDYEKKLKAVMQLDRFDSLENCLNEILIYNDKIHQKETDPSIRKLLCQRATLRDFKTFIRKHYPSYASQVNTVFGEKLRQTAAQKGISDFPNENVYHSGKTYLFFEVACEVLAQQEPDHAVYKENRDERHAKQGRNAYIHAVTAMDSPEPQLQQQSQHQPKQGFRNSTPGPHGPRRQQDDRRRNESRMGRSNNNRDNRDNRGRDQQNRGRSSRAGGGKPDYRCHLCNVLGHSFRECRTYANEPIGKTPCARCQGNHMGECRSYIRNQTPGPQNQEARGNQAQVMMLQGASQTPGPQNPQGQDRQNRPYPQNYNRYPTPGFGYQQNRQTRPYDRYDQRNYQDDRKSRSGYRREEQRSGYRGYNRSRSNYRNNNNYGRRSQSGYRNNYRYQQSNGNGRYTPYDRNQSRNDPRYMQQLDDVTRTMHQQQSQVPNQPRQQGLGNDGYQPLHPSAVLNTIEAFDTHMPSEQ